MKGSLSSSWLDVFSFTFMQQVKSKAFKIATVVVGAIVFIGIFILLTFSMKKVEEDKVFIGLDNIKDVFILDKTNEFSSINSFIDGYSQSNEVHPDLDKISFTMKEPTSQVAEEMSKLSDNTNAILIHISRSEDGILLDALLPEGTYITEDETRQLLENLVPIVEIYRISQSGLSSDQLSVLLTPTINSFVVAGEEEASIGEELIKFLLPMIYSFALYMLLIIYSQSIMNNLLIEKTSKLTEMLLTAVNPRRVITGKILAMAAVAIMQFLLWITCGIFGFIAGDAFLRNQYSDYTNPLLEIIKLVQENSDGMAFSVIAIILSLLALILGFLFYFSFAGVVGASLGKAEDISSGTGIFYLPVMIFGMAAMMSPVLEGNFWGKVMNYFPFSSPFVLAANIINGSMGILEGLFSIGILCISILICFILAGKLYKGLIFFKGEKLTVTNVVKVLRNKN